MPSMRRLFGLLFVAAAVLAAGGCYHIKTSGGDGGGSIPSGPTGNPSSPTPTPNGACGNFGSPTAIIDVTPEISPVKNPTYGTISEYALSLGSSLPVAAPISLTTADTVQFLNIDSVHEVSAVGMGTKGFPAVPFTFPSGTQSPVGTSIGASQWSTGRLGVNLSFGCYSQVFTMPSVTNGKVVEYFGDYDLYNPSNGTARNVIIVTGGGQAVRHRQQGTAYYRRPL
jgi:hypothetical protein